MKRKSRNTLPEYTLGEELVNSISHGVGAVLAIVAMIFCLIKAETTVDIVSSVLYGLAMFTLYLFSCLYHALSPNVYAKKVLRVLDHDNVFLMEAGTYMPICLSLLVDSGHNLSGWITFTIVCVVTVLAIVFTSINVDRFQLIGVICNLVLGWGSLFLLPVFLQVLPASGIFMLIIGGATYSLGALWYLVGSRVKWMHSVFHFYVLLASAFHFMFVYLYCL